MQFMEDNKSKIYRMTQHPGAQESWSCSSSLKAGKLKTQEDPIFQFQSKGRKRAMFQCDG